MLVDFSHCFVVGCCLWHRDNGTCNIVLRSLGDLGILKDDLPKLIFIISDNKFHDLYATLATENAIAAVTRVCNYLDNQVPLESVLPLWLSWLPVYEDKEEAPHVYSYLCKLIERWVWYLRLN